MSEHQQTQQSKKPDSTFQKPATLVSQIPVSHPASIIQRARINPKSLTSADVLQLQRTIGNRAVGRLLSEIRNPSKVQQVPIQRQEIPEEEEPLQGKMIETIQKQEIPEEEETLQGKMSETIQRQEIPEEEEPLQGKFESKPEKETCLSCMQRQEILEEEEPIQGKMIGTVQRHEIPEEEEPLQTKKENNTGMPDNLKAGVESLSGIDMSDVKVHYNSDKPAEVGALAYTQGTNIHVAPGQERHLPHEAWHVVQQAQGRVKPTMQMKNISINDDIELENEADMMGGRVVQMSSPSPKRRREDDVVAPIPVVAPPVPVVAPPGHVVAPPVPVVAPPVPVVAPPGHVVAPPVPVVAPPVVDATTMVTKEVALAILRNAAMHQHPFRPDLGLGGVSWFVTSGDPHTGIDDSKIIQVPVRLTVPPNAIIFDEDRLIVIHEAQMDAQRALITQQVIAIYPQQHGGLPAPGVLTRAMRGQIDWRLRKAAERQMWLEVAGSIRISPSGVGVVNLPAGGRFSRNEGQFTIVADPAKIQLGDRQTDQLLQNLTDRGINVPPDLQ